MPYDIKASESKWRDFWAKERIFEYKFNSNKPTFSIDTPPRYASGKLHIGHAFHYSHIDFIAKYQRLQGKNVFFPLCFDVNGMPIEVNVEKKYGIKMRDYPREEFVKLCEKFADENIDAMINQFKLLGITADSSLYYRTDGEYYRKLTQISFIKMYEKNLIYRGTFPVNWCPRCETAIAESEIVYEEKDVDLIDIIFKGIDLELTIATTRPELLPACVAVAVNPKDERYQQIIGKEVTIPLFERKVKIIADEEVMKEFGTGVEMVCSVGDKDDLRMIYAHSLPFIKSIDETGRMTEIAGKYKGLSTKDARKKIIEDLKQEGKFLKSIRTKHNVGTCWRCGSPLEFLQKEQWFVKATEFKEDLKKWSSELEWKPLFMKKRLDDWIESLSWDWVISRQRYFATPIPVWFCKNGHPVIAKEEQCYVDPLIDAPPAERCNLCGEKLEGSEEVFDTWMDSSISPLFNTLYGRDDYVFNKLYPMDVRTQGQDIIRTWAFYTLLRGRLLTGKNPWKTIMVDGNIMAPDGRPMHASWGNVVDPLSLLEKYGADPFRYFTSQCSLGEDTPFKERDMIRGQRFVNKIHNLVNFLEYHLGKDTKTGEFKPTDFWIRSELNRVIRDSRKAMDDYQFDVGMKAIEDFIWHKFADNYVEAVKHRMNEKVAVDNVSSILLASLVMISPIFPHVAEDSYQRLFRKEKGKQSIFDLVWPAELEYNKEKADIGRRTIEAIGLLRNGKVENRIPLSESLEKVTIYSSDRKEFDIDEIKGTIHAINVIFENKQIREEIVGIKLSPKIYELMREKAPEFIEYLLKNTGELKKQEIIYGEFKVRTEDLRVMSKFSTDESNVYCGEECCVNIKK